MLILDEGSGRDLLQSQPALKYKYLNVNLVFPHLGFWSDNFFLIAPFPDHCLLVPFYNNLL